ncbi:hypothetical protein [Burkholderia cepacia]|uniref:hypothetical protein n=1 Tax=Burkholderia cepacia TaxID=292 RepID=UPI00249E810E|nr:hypothetical protein [Burkholderia cepacia]
MSRFATTFPRRAGMVACVARRTALMIPTPLVPVEGALARPRVAPLDHVPPFGREWKFRGAPGAQPTRNCLATLTTSCIDVDRPHRACHWQPAPASTGVPVAPAVTGRRLPRTAGNRRDRRATYATCLSIGALGIIGWLIAVHELPMDFGSTHAIHTASTVPDHARSFNGTVHVAAGQPGQPTHAAPTHTVATPDTKLAESQPASHRVVRRPTPPHPQTTSDTQRTAAASPSRAGGRQSATTPARAPIVKQRTAHSPLQHTTATVAARERRAPPPLATDALDDPLTLIAMANALRGTEPAHTTHASATGFDWTSQRSHRRLTDTPDTPDTFGR